MGAFSFWHWLIVGAVVLLLFGSGGKIPKLARDLGQSINAFRKGLKETHDGEDHDPRQAISTERPIDRPEAVSSSEGGSSAKT